MRKLSVLAAFAGVVLGLACNDVTYPSHPAQFSNGTLRATEVAFEQAEAAEVEFTGVITAIIAPDLIVAGVTVRTNSATEIELKDVKIAFSDLKLGETVEVEGTLQSDHSVLAREIQLE